jgi:hypothetical protein
MTAVRPLALLLLLLPASALAEKRPVLIDTNPPYVQVVVTACPAAETPLEPTNHGKSYENERGMTREERNAYFREIGCIEVPIPPEWIAQELSYRQWHRARRLPRVDAVSRAEQDPGQDTGRRPVGLHSRRHPLRRGRVSISTISTLYPLMRVRLGGSPKAPA